MSTVNGGRECSIMGRSWRRMSLWYMSHGTRLWHTANGQGVGAWMASCERGPRHCVVSILLPRLIPFVEYGCRLPTEAEWEMAALCVPSEDGHELQQNDEGTGPYKRT